MNPILLLYLALLRVDSKLLKADSELIEARQATVSNSFQIEMVVPPPEAAALEVYGEGNQLELSVSSSGVWINGDCLSTVTTTKEQCEEAIGQAFKYAYPNLMK